MDLRKARASATIRLRRRQAMLRKALQSGTLTQAEHDAGMRDATQAYALSQQEIAAVIRAAAASEVAHVADEVRHGDVVHVGVAGGALLSCRLGV